MNATTTKFGGLVLAAALSLSAAFAQNTNPNQDMRAAGHDTKGAVSNTGHGIASGTKKVYHKSAHGVKKGYRKTKHALTPHHDTTPQETPDQHPR